MSSTSFHISKKAAGVLEGQRIFHFVLDNGSIKVGLMNYGATIMSIEVPDKYGVKKNIVAGFETFPQYLQDHPYFGCMIGRFANRIAFGKFSIDRTEYSLSVNNPPNHLHGGWKGFDKKVWRVTDTIEEENRVGIVLELKSEDGDEGYPGTVHTKVTYLLAEDNKLHIQCHAITNQPTIVNLTNHSYFNLSGFEAPTIKDHLLQIDADHYLVKNNYQVPTGEVAAVKDGFFDFTVSKKMGDHILLIPDEPGYDHTFVLNNKTTLMQPGAKVWDPVSGRELKVFTDQPGIHVYTANWWDGSLKDPNGRKYEQHGAIALETQAFPDAPNHNNFPDTVLRPGQVYESKTIFQFSVV
ncbi:MAG: aldose epimerase family protein [Chitinophagales bacterium]